MQFCKGYNIPIIDVISLTKDSHEKFCKCPKCYSETKHRNIKDNELNFGEVLHKEFQKRK